MRLLPRGLWGIFFAAVAAAQHPANPPFRSAVSVVEVDVAVAGREGPIDGLQLGDFAVQDNHRSVALRYVSQEETALDVVLLFEVSKLMAPKLTQVRAAAEMVLAELRGSDRVAAMSFNQDAHLELPLTGDLKAAKVGVRNGLSGALFSGRAALLPAAEEAAKYLARLPIRTVPTRLIPTGMVRGRTGAASWSCLRETPASASKIRAMPASRGIIGARTPP